MQSRPELRKHVAGGLHIILLNKLSIHLYLPWAFSDSCAMSLMIISASSASVGDVACLMSS